MRDENKERVRKRCFGMKEERRRGRRRGKGGEGEEERERRRGGGGKVKCIMFFFTFSFVPFTETMCPLYWNVVRFSELNFDSKSRFHEPSPFYRTFLTFPNLPISWAQLASIQCPFWGKFWGPFLRTTRSVKILNFQMSHIWGVY